MFQLQYRLAGETLWHTCLERDTLDEITRSHLFRDLEPSEQIRWRILEAKVLSDNLFRF